jgi:hypothetical protein
MSKTKERGRHKAAIVELLTDALCDLSLIVEGQRLEERRQHHDRAWERICQARKDVAEL